MGLYSWTWDSRLEEAEGALERGTEEGAEGGDPRATLRRAAELSGEVLECQPEHPRALEVRAEASFLLGVEAEWRKEDPLPFFRRAIEDHRKLPPEPTSGHYLDRTWALVKAIGHSSGAGEEIRHWARDAAANLEQALALSPDDPDALWLQGELSLALGDAEEAEGGDPLVHYDQAALDFEKAGEGKRELLEDGLGRIEARRGDALRLRGQDPLPAYRKAVRHFQESARRSPDDRAAQVHFGKTLLLLSDTLSEAEARTVREKARRCFDTALAQDPCSVAALSGRAEATCDMAEGLPRVSAIPLLAEAVLDLERARSLAPSSLEVSRALVATRIELLSRCEELDPKNRAQLAPIAKAALDDYDRILRLDPHCPEARRLRAIFQLHLIYYSKPLVDIPRTTLLASAIADLSLALASGHAETDTFYWRSMARLTRAQERGGQEGLKDLIAAERDIEEVLGRTPQNPSAKSLRAQVLLARAGAEFEMGIASLETCRRVLEAHPDGIDGTLSLEDLAVLAEVRRRLGGEA